MYDGDMTNGMGNTEIPGNNTDTNFQENGNEQGETVNGANVYMNKDIKATENYGESQINENFTAEHNTSSVNSNASEKKTEAGQVYASYHINNNENNSGNFQKNKKTGNGGKNFAAKTVAAGLAIGIIAFGVVYGLSSAFPFKTKTAGNLSKTSVSTATPVSSVSNKDAQISTSVYDVSAVVKEVKPSVVSISCTGTVTYQSFFGSQSQQYSSAGSGIIVGSNDTELLIATNNHVITDAEKISIQFDDESKADASIKGTSSDVDLAVVAVKLSDLSEETKNAIKVATLGTSEELIVGEPAIAIGNALGYGQSVTSGVISALNREVTVNTDETYGFGNSQQVTSKLIQTDAAINPGNSGGPLLNSKGEVIGINSVKYASSEVEGMGYAIPIDKAQPILKDLMSRETKSKVAENEQSYLGIQGANVTSDAISVYGMPAGVYVAQVIDGSGAEKGGIKRGDIICEVDGTSVSSMDDLQEEMLYHKAGSKVEITVSRSSNGEYKKTKLEITLGSKADAPASTETPSTANPSDNNIWPFGNNGGNSNDSGSSNSDQ